VLSFPPIRHARRLATKRAASAPKFRNWRDEMPGIVGLVGAADSGRVATALQKMSYLDTYQSSILSVSPTLTLGCAGRASQINFATSLDEEHSRVSVLLYGVVFSQRPVAHRVPASDVLTDYQAGGFRQLRESYEGSFSIAVVDLKAQRLYIGTDRVGTQPVYYRQHQGMLAFGPEIKAVTTVSKADAVLSEPGIVNLLITGYSPGESTIFKDVQQLEPGSLLTFDLSTGTMSQERYWKIVYEPAGMLAQRGPATEALFESNLRAHQLQLVDNPREFDLFLSGGMDSRGILGTLDQLGRLPNRALGWGLRDDIPRSDAWVAKQLAGEFELDFHFMPYDTDQLTEIAGEWVYVSELVNDNIGRYGEGMGAVRKFYSTGADFTFIGDEAWGWHGYAGTEAEARALVMPASMSTQLKSIVRTDQQGRFQALYDASISRIMRDCENTDPTDRKDFLYLHGRVAGFIFSLGYYREIASEMRRPFLSNEVLDVVRRLPKEYRVHKNLFISMLEKFLPKTMKYPEMDVPSLPDWSYDLRYKEPMRTYFRELLEFSNLEDGPLGTMIDRRGFETLRDEFFASHVQPVNRVPSTKRRIKRAARHAVVTRPRLDRLLTSLRTQMSPVSPSNSLDPLWRIALCVLLQRNLARFQGAR
jgi:hypothetical protein